MSFDRWKADELIGVIKLAAYTNHNVHVDMVIDEVARRLSVVTDADGDMPTFAELATFRQYGKVRAIKAYRDRTGLSLKEAKKRFDAAIDELNIYTLNT